MKFATLYILPEHAISEKISVWGSLGYGIIADDSGFADMLAQEITDELEDVVPNGTIITTKAEFSSGMTYGFGLHCNINEKIGIGIGMVTNELNLEISVALNENSILDEEADIDDIERTNIYLSYKF